MLFKHELHINTEICTWILVAFSEGLQNASTFMYSLIHVLNLWYKWSWIGDPESNDMCATLFAHGGRIQAKEEI